MKRTALLLALFGAVVLACGGGTPTWQQAPSTNKPRMNVMVQFSDASVHPETARVLAGGTVVWTNYSTNYDGTVVFPESIAESFTCSQLRPIFMKTDTGYNSIPILQDSEDVKLPCPLKPGEYSYEIWLFESEFDDPTSGMSNPNVRLPAKIVVGGGGSQAP